MTLVSDTSIGTGQILAFLEAITNIESLLPPADREQLRCYQESAEFKGDSRWPGWHKYLGQRPEPRPRLRLMDFKKQRSA